MDRLSPEILEEILLRVPVKSLARCKCVSQPWLDIIEHPSFNKVQFARIANGEIKTQDESDVMLYCYSMSYPVSSGAGMGMYLLGMKDDIVKCAKFNIEDISLREMFLLGSIKGFLCLCKCDYWHANLNLYFVYNPVTREYFQLPQSLVPNNNANGIWKNMAIGFGFVESTNEFKVVTVFTQGHQQKKVQVLTLGSTTWRTIEYSVRFETSFCIGEHFNGILHWPSTLLQDRAIVSFDVKNEEFGVVPLPEGMILGKKIILCLGLLDGCISIAHDSKYCIEIWTMKEYNVHESWSRLLIVVKNTVSRSRRPGVKPIVLTKNGGVVLLGNCLYLFSYNPVSQKCRALCHKLLQLINNNIQFHLQATSYVPSFFRLSQHLEWRNDPEN